MSFHFRSNLSGCILKVQQRLGSSLQQFTQLCLAHRRILLALRRRHFVQDVLEDPRPRCEHSLSINMSIIKLFRNKAKCMCLKTLTAHTGSLVLPTKNVMSHSSGIEAKNFMSSPRPALFSNIDQSGSTSGIPPVCRTSGILAVY